jgi:O-antigen ligase
MIRQSVSHKDLVVQNNISVKDEQQTKKDPQPGDTIAFLFLFFALSLTLPIIDIPLLGLSLSAPVFLLVAMPVLLRPTIPWLGAHKRWIFIGVLIWVGIFLSATLNGLLSGGTRVDLDSLVYLVRYAYWFLVLVVTVYLISSQIKLAERLVRIIAIGIFALGVLRLGEAIFGGAIGAWTRLHFITQNGYGIQFSMFYPLLLSFVYWGPKRKLAMLALPLVLAAILLNGSRSNWIATLVGTVVFLWMHLRTQPRRARAVAILLLLVSMIGLGALFAPQEVTSAFEARFSTLEKLEQDKTFVIRQLMTQKGLRLFQASPWTGVGVSRWRKESIPLEIPRVLSYAPQSHFDAKSSHNSYISFLAENGLVGTIPFGFLLLTLTIRGYSASRNLAMQGQVWVLGIYASFIGMSVHLWSLSGLTGTAPWFLYGLLAAVIVLDNRSSHPAENQPSYARRLSLPYSRHF